MTRDEINQRLFEFNMTGNWDVFKDVPEDQQYQIMYPHVIIPGDYERRWASKEEYLMQIFPHERVIKSIELHRD